MTETDLRIQFKLDTGEYPTWLKTITGDFKKKLKSIYGFWLEDKLGNSNELRQEFLSSYVYYNSGSAIYYSNKRTVEILTQNYILWLEEKQINKLNRNA